MMTTADPNRGHLKKSILSVGALMLSLAALQSPLWHPNGRTASVAVRSGGVTLISADAPIAEIAINGPQATAEIVGEREILIRGKALGESPMSIVSKSGKINTVKIVVRSESARSNWTLGIAR